MIFERLFLIYFLFDSNYSVPETFLGSLCVWEQGCPGAFTMIARRSGKLSISPTSYEKLLRWKFFLLNCSKEYLMVQFSQSLQFKNITYVVYLKQRNIFCVIYSAVFCKLVGWYDSPTVDVYKRYKVWITVEYKLHCVFHRFRLLMREDYFWVPLNNFWS